MGFAEDLVKIELHCHLDGSMEVSDVQQLLEAQGTVYTCEELEKRLKVSSDCTSLTEYLEKFDLPLSCLQTKEGLYRAAVSVVRAAARDNVRYMEVRFAPMLSLNAGLNCQEVIESVVEGLEAGGRQYGVYASAIVCAMRHHLPEKNMEMLRTAREFLGNGVCALDLAGTSRHFRQVCSGTCSRRPKNGEYRLPYTRESVEVLRM